MQSFLYIVDEDDHDDDDDDDDDDLVDDGVNADNDEHSSADGVHFPVATRVV